MDHEEWTFEEKKKILGILYECGAGNYDLIHKSMPEKTLSEIQAFCDKYMQISMGRWERSKANKKSGDAALKNWLTIMKRVSNSQSGSLTDMVPRVLKYIALFEKRTEASIININDCYMVLSHISEGLPAKKIDEMTAYFFYECLLKLAKSVKHSGSGSSLCYIKYLSNLDEILNDKKSAHNKNKTGNSSVVNPLGIPKELLKMSELEKNISIFD